VAQDPTVPVIPVHLDEPTLSGAVAPAAAPSRRGWTDGAAWGAAVGVVVAMVGHVGASPWDVLLGVVLGGLALALVDGVVAAVRAAVRLLVRRRFPGLAARLGRARTIRVSFPLTGLVLVLGPWLAPARLFGIVNAGAAGSLVVVATTIVGAALGWASGRRSRTTGLVALSAIAVGAVPLLWLADAGAGAGVVAPMTPAPVAALDLPDPGAPGPFTVRTATYGSGVNPHRPAFGAAATLTTEPLDGRGVAPTFGWAHRVHVRLATGASPDRLPIDATVWYPAEAEAAPLVLVVHGNHALSQASDPGYAYLGRHLASHGYVVASVDENFLNGSVAGDGRGTEQPLRVRVLLEHLRAWAAWASDGGPFDGRVDLEQVALIGHSRGGEAAAHAAAIARDPSQAPGPDWPALDDAVQVRAVVAIMPSDGGWEPAAGPRRLRDVSYLVLGAGLDGDATTWQGLAQYHRIDLTPGPSSFAAFAYLQRANHGQANTVWGRNDQGWLESAILDRGGLLVGEEQRRATRMLVTAFLDAALRGEDGSRAVFTRPDAARAWLPDDVVVTGYRDGSSRALRRSRPEAGESATVAGGDVDVLTLRARDGERSLGTTAVRLTWPAGAATTLRYAVADGDPAPHPGDVLSVAYGSADLAAPARLEVEVADRDGVRASLPVDLTTALRPPLPARVAKLPTVAARYGVGAAFAWPAEYLLQTYELPLSAFATAQPELDLDRLATVTIRPETGRAAEVHVGEVAFRHRTAGELAATGDRAG
jgi:dienelactone hydrolase